MKLRIKWRDHLSSEKTFNLLSLFWSFYQHMHFNAINQFNKIMRFELPFVSSGGAMQGAKCPGSHWKVICEHVCNSYFVSLFSISGLRFGMGLGLLSTEPAWSRAATETRSWGPVLPGEEPAGTGKQSWTREQHWGAVRRASEAEVCERCPHKGSVRLPRLLTWEVTIHCYLTSGVLHWNDPGCMDRGWRRTRKVWKPLPMSRPASEQTSSKWCYMLMAQQGRRELN